MVLFLLQFFGGLFLIFLIGWIIGKLLHLDNYYFKNDDHDDK